MLKSMKGPKPRIFKRDGKWVCGTFGRIGSTTIGFASPVAAWFAWRYTSGFCVH